MKSFQDKVFVITGAASGIGRALATSLANQGAKLALCDVDEAGLDETSAQLGNQQHFTQKLDVTDQQAFNQFADQVTENFGHVDAVINNAAVMLIASGDDQPRAEFERLVNINFWGVVNGTEAFLPKLKTRPEAAIINISDVFGLIGFPSQSAYVTTKFAIRGYTESLRHDLKSEYPNILVANVHPGGIKTPIIRNARFRKGLGNDNHDTTVQMFDKNAWTTADKAAEVILKGIRKRNSRILIGPDARAIDWIQRLFPKSYFSIIGRLIKG